MNSPNQMRKSFELLKLLITISALVIVAAGCTKSRDTEFADEKVAAEVTAIAELQNQSFTLETASADQFSVRQLKASAIPKLEKPLVEVKGNSAPAKLSDLLKNISIVGQENKALTVKLEVTSKAVDVLAVYSSKEGLSTLEKAMAIASGDKFLVPIVRIPVKAYGIVEQIKNEDKEKTSKVTLAPSKFESATHVQLDLNKDSLIQPLQVEAEKFRTELFERSELSNTSFEIATVSLSANESASLASELNSFATKSVAKISSTTVSAKLAGVLNGQIISAPANATFQAKIVPTRDGLMLVRKVQNESELSELEKTLAQKTDAGTFVHIGTIKIKSSGSVHHLMTNQGEPLRSIEIRPTDFNSATFHIIDLNSDSFDGIKQSLAAQKVFKSLYLREDLDKKVFTLSQLTEMFKFQTPDDEGEKFFVDVQRTAGAGLVAKMFQVMTLDQLRALDRKSYDLLLIGLTQPQVTVAYCSAELKAQLPQDERPSCVVLLKYTAGLTNVALKPQLNAQGEASISTVVVEEQDSRKPSNYIKIAEHLPLTEKFPTNISPYNSISPKEVVGKEFLFRRTMSDSSIASVLAPGFSGELSIVTMQFTNDSKLIVRNADTTKIGTGGEIDREPLMVIPVTYLKKNPDQGAAEPFLPALRSQADWAVLDWSKNELGVNNSPVSWLNSCFANQAETAITNVDNRIGKDGILNFTLLRTNTLSDDCLTSYYLNDAWWGTTRQSNMSFEERVSFKLYTKAGAEKTDLDLPFRAQNLMGFGAFTIGKIKPDDFGNSGRIDNEVSMPLTHDFSGGKVLTYVLGGIPAEGWMREALIESAQEVIADWNATLHYAFKHTALERSGDYIVLKVEGSDIAEGGLGDLDRNYIWNYTKSLDAGPLGLSIAGPNPRSGKVEHNNVLMYAGNLWQMVGYMKQNAIAQKQYEDMKLAALEEAKKKADEEAKKQEPVPALNGPSGLKFEDGELARAIGIVKPSTIASHPSVQGKVMSAAQEERFEKIDQSMHGKSSAYLHRILKKALEQNAAKDPNMLGALSAAEILKTFGTKLSPVERQALVAQTQRLALTAELEKHLRKVGGCLMTKSASAAGGDFDWINGDPKEIFKSQYKFTLSHEIGHSLGMTHNFIASADKANFEFEGQELGRRYSSVMDYLPDDVISYKGLGPYDAHIMRAIHAHHLELGAEALANVKDGVLSAVTAAGEEIQVPVKGGKLIAIEDVKKIALGNDSWWNLDQAKLSAVGLKKYLYCSDMEADGNGSPLCNRWDAGGSAAEIVNYYANEYRSAYPLLNHKGNRINIVGFGSYVGRLFSYLLPIRFFNEELFYQLITRSFTSQEELNDYIEAALTAHSFLLEVVATPTAPKAFFDSSRFVPFSYTETVPDENGQPVEKEFLTVVETKSNSDLAAPGVPNVMDTRGVEIDKAVGLLMLTQQDMGHPRYSANSIRFSFAELESMLMGRKSINTNMTMRLLHRLIGDNAMTIANTPHGPRLLPPSFVSETSDIVRYYALLGSNVFIDSEGISSDTNLALRFHTASTKATLEDRYQVSKMGEALASPHVVKFHALEGAESSHDLIRRSAQKRAAVDNQGALTEAYAKALTAITPEEQAAAVAATVEKVKALNVKGLIVNDAERAQRLSEEILVGASLQFAAQTQAMIEKNWQIFAMFEGMIVEILKPTKNTNEANAKGIQFLNAIGAKTIEALYAEVSEDGISDPEELEKVKQENAIREIKRNFLNAIINTDVLEVNHGVVVNNLQRQNQMLEIMYPEKNR